MLGIKTPNEMINGMFAENIREQVRRISTRNFNVDDMREMNRRNNLRANSQYSVVWGN